MTGYTHELETAQRHLESFIEHFLENRDEILEEYIKDEGARTDAAIYITSAFAHMSDALSYIEKLPALRADVIKSGGESWGEEKRANMIAWVSSIQMVRAAARLVVSSGAVTFRGGSAVTLREVIQTFVEIFREVLLADKDNSRMTAYLVGLSGPLVQALLGLCAPQTIRGMEQGSTRMNGFTLSLVTNTLAMVAKNASEFFGEKDFIEAMDKSVGEVERRSAEMKGEEK